MKKNILIITCLLLTLSANSQKLVDLYEKGSIRLVPDTEYAIDNDWNKIFRSYKNSKTEKHIGARESLVIMPDGSVVVNHAKANYYSMFSPQGKFVKEFGIKDANGQPLKRINGIEGIIGNNTFFTCLDNIGNMYYFNFNGKLVKKLKLDYMSKQMISLPNGKIAVVGWVILKNKTRDFVAIIDYSTNKEKVIWEHDTDRDGITGNSNISKSGLTVAVSSPSASPAAKAKKNDGQLSTFTFSVPSARPVIASVDNRLIVSLPASGEILTFDLNGHLLSKDKTNWAAKYFSVKEQKENQQNIIDRFRSSAAFETDKSVSQEKIMLARKRLTDQLESDMDKIKTPRPLPIFSTIIKDSDGNLLFFEYPKEDNENRFNVWVYEKGGRFVCQSHFVCDDYDLYINPSRMVFRGGYLYSLQTRKNVSGISMRLVRFKLTAAN